MYLHCRHGFVEADAWDGQPVPGHKKVVDAVAKASGAVIVARARRADTLQQLVAHLPRRHEGGVLPRIEVIQSPLGWDYEWRVYLTPVEWGMCLTRVAMDLDYRNFKHTAQDGRDINRREHALAYAIWNAAYSNVPRDKDPATLRLGEPTERDLMDDAGDTDQEEADDALALEDLERDLWKGGALR